MYNVQEFSVEIKSILVVFNEVLWVGSRKDSILVTNWQINLLKES